MSTPSTNTGHSTVPSYNLGHVIVVVVVVVAVAVVIVVAVVVVENCTLVGYYASVGNSLTTFRDNLSVP